MAVENIKSTKITNLEASPVVKPDFSNYGAALRVFVDTFDISETTTSNTSTYRAVRLPSSAKLIWGTIRGDGTVDAPDMDVGVISVADETVLDDDSLITALDVDDTGDHLFAGDSYTHDESKEMWQYTNATEDPGGEMDLLFSLDANAVAAGTCKVVVYAIVDEG